MKQFVFTYRVEAETIEEAAQDIYDQFYEVLRVRDVQAGLEEVTEEPSDNS